MRDDRRRPIRSSPRSRSRSPTRSRSPAQGALLERCFTTPHTGKATWELICRASREVGPEHTVWSSDLGQVFNPPVEDGLALMADQFLEAGFSDEEVVTMAVTNTRRLRGGGGAREPADPGDRRALGRLRLARRRRDRGRDRGRRRRRGDRAQLRRARRVRRAVEAGGPDDRERQAPAPRARRRRPRRISARASAASTSATTRSQIDGDALLLIADAIREFAPDVLVTHTDTDPFNPDHPVAYAAVDRARSLAAGRRRRERVRDDHAAGALPLRAPPAGAVQLHAEDVRRHHRR